MLMDAGDWDAPALQFWSLSSIPRIEWKVGPLMGARGPGDEPKGLKFDYRLDGELLRTRSIIL
jgi:hypothetical protein